MLSPVPDLQYSKPKIINLRMSTQPPTQSPPTPPPQPPIIQPPGPAAPSPPPSPPASQPLPPPILIALSTLCTLHSQPLTKYCETCHDVICQQCSAKQPHSNLLHKVDLIDSSFKRRVEFIDNYIQTEVNAKREKIMDHVEKIKERTREIEETANVIKKDVEVEMQGVSARLDEAEAARVVGLQAEVKRLSAEVNAIDDVFYSFEESIKVPEKFLLLYKEFRQKINSIEAYAVTSEVSIDLNLPRQIQWMEEKKELVGLMQKKSKFLDEIIFQIVSTYVDYVEKVNADVKTKNQQILGTYFKLEEDLIEKNAILLKSCYYCGLALSRMSMNTACAVNKSAKFQRQGYTCQKPTEMYNGNKRHYWGKSTLQNRSKVNFTKFGGPNAEKIYLNSLKRLRLSLAQIYSYMVKNEATIYKLFEVEATQLYVSKLKFIYALTHKVKLEQHEAEVLATLLTSEKGIEFGKLQHSIMDRKHFEKQFQKEVDDEREKRNSFAPKSRSRYY